MRKTPRRGAPRQRRSHGERRYSQVKHSALAALACVAAIIGNLRAEEARWRPTGRNVLVVYAADDADRDRSGKPDSLEAAEYYARRRGVPAENLLGLTLARGRRRRTWTYPGFFRRILAPVREKLAAPGPDGKPLARRICYILLCPHLPYVMDTGHRAPKGSRNWFAKTHRRSVDQYLISVEANFRAGVNEQTSAPGAGRSGPLGAWQGELLLPLYGAYARPGTSRHFRRLRQEQPERFDFYLVSRLGLNLPAARDMLDGALYAERHLRLPGPEEKDAPRPEIWLDQKYKFARDHVAAMSRLVAIVQGLPGSPFAAGEGLRRRWRLVIDNQLAEIGMAVAGGLHKPTVSAKIAPDGVDEKGITLAPPRKIGSLRDVPTALYFPVPCTVTNGQVRARAVAIDAGRNRLLLDRTSGFAPGQTVRWTWPGRFPAQRCFFFYGFYGLGKYEDVFRFPPGALGVHVDSACMRWARAAMSRGIAATFGVTSEPLSIGIPHGHLLLTALGRGYDWAEAAYGSLRLGQRWAGVLLGDPLYAPFRSGRLPDTTPPVLGEVQVRSGTRGVTIAVSLSGSSPEELADVALFRLEYGPDRTYGQAVDFFDWPEPKRPTSTAPMPSGRPVKGRRFGYSRHFRWSLKGLKKGRTYHYRLTARDPAGNETVVRGVFTP